jgi:hypothetical protein
MAGERQVWQPDMRIVPGALVWPRQEDTGPKTTNVTLWKDQGGSGITGKAMWNRVGLVLARHIAIGPEQKGLEGLGDQVMVLFGDQFGWNETRMFELVP